MSRLWVRFLLELNSKLSPVPITAFSIPFDSCNAKNALFQLLSSSDSKVAIVNRDMPSDRQQVSISSAVVTLNRIYTNVYKFVYYYYYYYYYIEKIFFCGVCAGGCYCQRLSLNESCIRFFYQGSGFDAGSL